MCDICLRHPCPAACPNHHESSFECANCGEETYEYEVSEILDDGKVICETCAAFVAERRLDRVRERHTRSTEQILRAWGRT